MDKNRAKRLLAQKKRAGKSAEQARREVARETGYSTTDLMTISFVMLTTSDCGGSSDSGSSYDSSSSCDSGSY